MNLAETRTSWHSITISRACLHRHRVLQQGAPLLPRKVWFLFYMVFLHQGEFSNFAPLIDHSLWGQPAAMAWGHSDSPMEKSTWGRTEASHQQPALICRSPVREPSQKWTLLPQPTSWLQPHETPEPPVNVGVGIRLKHFIFKQQF